MGIPTKTARELVDQQLATTKNLYSLGMGHGDFQVWQRNTHNILMRIFGPDSSQASDFDGISYYSLIIGDDSHDIAAFNRGIDRARSLLRSMLDEIDLDESLAKISLDDTLNEKKLTCSDTDFSKERIIHILKRFHFVARQIRNRHDGRTTLTINDEYDVQDLLHSLLKIDFDDIRPEEWTPSYAGKSSRVDFLLKSEKIVIEIKKTREKLEDKKIGEELIIDIARYQSHPDCNHLICFVYDPESRISNPVGLTNDLEKLSENLEVTAIVVP